MTCFNDNITFCIALLIDVCTSLQLSVQQFQKDPEVKVALLSILAAGVVRFTPLLLLGLLAQMINHSNVLVQKRIIK